LVSIADWDRILDQKEERKLHTTRIAEDNTSIIIIAFTYWDLKHRAQSFVDMVNTFINLNLSNYYHPFKGFLKFIRK
jgi:hypothetical protein